MIFPLMCPQQNKFYSLPRGNLVIKKIFFFLPITFGKRFKTNVKKVNLILRSLISNQYDGSGNNKFEDGGFFFLLYEHFK